MRYCLSLSVTVRIRFICHLRRKRLKMKQPPFDQFNKSIITLTFTISTFLLFRIHLHNYRKCWSNWQWIIWRVKCHSNQKYSYWASTIVLNFVSYWSVSPGIHSRRWQNLSFPIDIQGTLDKQAPNMSPLNLWMTNGQSESSLFDVQTFCTEKFA